MSAEVYTEADWKLFRKRLPQWQESHMQGLLNEYSVILASSDNPSTKFWELEKRLRNDKRAVGVSAEMRRSRLVSNLLSLLMEGSITPADLEGFSDPLRESLMRSLAFLSDNQEDGE